jgi:hypothetical protein
MIPLCSRFDSLLFTPKRSAIATAGYFSRCPNGLITAGGGTKPTGLYTISDQDQWAVRLRVNRNFYP